MADCALSFTAKLALLSNGCLLSSPAQELCRLPWGSKQPEAALKQHRVMGCPPVRPCAGGAAASCAPLAFLPRFALAGRAVLAFLLGRLSFCCTPRRDALVALPDAAAPAGAGK